MMRLWKGIRAVEEVEFGYRMRQENNGDLATKLAELGLQSV